MTTSCETEFNPAQRQARSLIATAERTCLIAIATRLPRRITSDHLTALALLAMVLAGASYWAARLNRQWLLAVVMCLGLNWFGDSLDGTVARVRQQQRPRYGFYIDHMVDCLGVLLLLGGLALSGFMSPLIAMGVLVAYLLLSIEIYLATYCVSVFRLSFWGMGPTELRLLLAAGSVALMRDPHVQILRWSFPLFDVGGAVAIVSIGATMLISLAKNARALYIAEPPTSTKPFASV